MNHVKTVYFVTPSIGDFHNGPAIYTDNLWKLYRDRSDLDFHVIALQSRLTHPNIHVPESESLSRVGFYQRLQEFTEKTLERRSSRSILHLNSAHLLRRTAAIDLPTIAQINDTEVCNHRWSIRNWKQSSLRRMAAMSWRRHREHQTARTCEKIVCNSDFTRRAVMENYRLAESKVTRIYKAVQLASFLSTHPDPQADGQLRMIFIGTNWDVKGLSVLIRAIPNLKAMNKWESIQLSVYGNPAQVMQHRHRRLVDEMKASSNVSFCGHLSRSAAPTEIAKHQMLVLPSFQEALGLVAIEAIATGIPVVASRIGGIPEVITSKELGTLFEVGDVDALAQAIKRTADETGANHRYVETRKESSKRFGLEMLESQLNFLYNEAFHAASAPVANESELEN